MNSWLVQVCIEKHFVGEFFRDILRAEELWDLFRAKFDCMKFMGKADLKPGIPTNGFPKKGKHLINLEISSIFFFLQQALEPWTYVLTVSLLHAGTHPGLGLVFLHIGLWNLVAKKEPAYIDVVSPLFSFLSSSSGFYGELERLIAPSVLFGAKAGRVPLA